MNILRFKLTQLALFWFVSMLVLSLAELVGVMRLIANVIQVSLSPVMLAQQQLVYVVQQPFVRAKSLFRSVERIQDLELRLSEALAQVSLLEGVAAENQDLRSLIENADRKLQRVVLAQPIVSYAQPALAVDSSLVTTGNPVLVGGTVVGRINTENLAGNNFVTVDLLTQPQTSGLVVKVGKYEGITKGSGRKVEVVEPARDALISLGDKVVTIGQPGVQQDLLVGRVAKLNTDTTAATQTIEIEQLVSFYDARIAEIYIQL